MSFVPLNEEQKKQVHSVYYEGGNYWGRDRLVEAIQNRFPDFKGSERAVLDWLGQQKTWQTQNRGIRKTETKPFTLTKRGFLCTDTIDLTSTPWKLEQYAIVVTDAYTRYLSCVSLRDKTAESCAKAFEKILSERPHSDATCCFSDLGNEYTTGAFPAMLKRRGIKQLTSAPHSPFMNGISERSVGTIMRLVFADRMATGRKDWPNRLKLLCDNYNALSHASTKKSPIELENAVEDDPLHADAKHYQAGKTAKRYKNKSIGSDLQDGTIVLTKKLDLAANFKANREGYFDTTKRFEVIGRSAKRFNRLPTYKLRRLRDMQTMPHNYPRWQLLPVEKPKAWKADRGGVADDPPDEGDPEVVAEEEEDEVPLPRRSLRGTGSYEVQEILDKRGRGHASEYLVRWAGYKLSDSSWEPLKNLKNAKDLVKDFEEGR